MAITLDYISVVIVIQRGGDMVIVTRRRDGSNVVIVQHLVLPEYILKFGADQRFEGMKEWFRPCVSIRNFKRLVRCIFGKV